MRTLPLLALAALSLLAGTAVQTQGKPRARDLGIPFDGASGPFNAITDVAGVEVGQTTLISGDGPDPATSSLRSLISNLQSELCSLHFFRRRA